MPILCATDFSERAQQATDVAARLATRLGERLVLATVVEPFSAGLFDLAAEARAFERTVRTSTEKTLRETVEQLQHRAPSLAVEGRLIEGTPWDALAALGRELSARYIVVGNHGRRKLEYLLLGSVAARLLQRADTPVLVVGGPSPGLLSFAAGERPLRVVAGIDLYETLDPTLDYLSALRELGPMHCTLVHFFPQYAMTATANLYRWGRSELERRFGNLDQARISLQIAPDTHPPGQSLAKLAEERHADLVIVMTHRRHGLRRMWLGSAAEDLIADSGVPVLSIPLMEPKLQKQEEHPSLRTVVFPTDFSQESLHALPYAYAMAQDGTVMLCHVLEKAEEKDEVEKALQALVPDAATQPSAHTLTFVLDGGDRIQALVRLCEQTGADAFCLGVRPHGPVHEFLGSLPRELLKRAAKPVLLVQRPTQPAG